MAGSVNRVVLCGNVGQNPDVRRTKTGGNRMANLSVATSKRWRDKDGERQEATIWHRVVTFDDDLAAMIEKQIKKGSQVLVIGELQNRKWTDKDGIERWTTEIVVGPFGGNTITPAEEPQGVIMWNWLNQLFSRRKPIHPVVAKFNELRDANLHYDEIFGPENWHYVERGQPYAKVGDIVTCEQGHKICRVIRQINVADLYSGSHLKFEYTQEEPPYIKTTSTIECEICNAPWWQAGYFFHFDDGWRIGR